MTIFAGRYLALSVLAAAVVQGVAICIGSFALQLIGSFATGWLYTLAFEADYERWLEQALERTQ